MRGVPRTRLTKYTPDIVCFNQDDVPITPQQNISPYNFNLRDCHLYDQQMTHPCDNPQQKLTYSYHNSEVVTPERSNTFVEFQTHTQPQTSRNVSQISNEHQNVIKPRDSDVLSGRGSGITSHPGNEYLRDLVASAKSTYLLKSSKGEKTRIGQSIVNHIRSRHPPGRFLARYENNESGHDTRGLWYEIGDVRARQKVNQCLREGAKEIKAAAQKRGTSHSDDEMDINLEQSSSSEMTAGNGNHNEQCAKRKPNGITISSGSFLQQKKSPPRHVRHNSTGHLATLTPQRYRDISPDQIFCRRAYDCSPSGRVTPDRSFHRQASHHVSVSPPPMISTMMHNQSQSSYFQRTNSDPSHEIRRNTNKPLYRQPPPFMPHPYWNEGNASNISCPKVMTPNGFYSRPDENETTYHGGKGSLTDCPTSFPNNYFHAKKNPSSFEDNRETYYNQETRPRKYIAKRRSEDSDMRSIDLQGERYFQTGQERVDNQHTSTKVCTNDETSSSDTHFCLRETPVHKNSSSFLFDPPCEAKKEDYSGLNVTNEQEIVTKRHEVHLTLEIHSEEHSQNVEENADCSLDISYVSEISFPTDIIENHALAFAPKDLVVACRNDHEELNNSFTSLEHACALESVCTEGHLNEHSAGDSLQNFFSADSTQDRSQRTLYEDNRGSLIRKNSNSSCFSMSVAESIMSNFSERFEQYFGTLS